MSTELTVQQEQGLSVAQNVLTMIERAAKDPTIDVDKMSALFDFQMKVMDKQAEVSFNRAFAEAIQEMPKVAKNGVIDFGAGKAKLPYTKYEDLDKAVRPIEKQHGFSRSFISSNATKDGVEVTMVVSHKDGHAKTSTEIMPPDTGTGRNALQARRSSRSYAKRFLTTDFWNIIAVGEDDDGNGSGIISDAQLGKLQRMIEECGDELDKGKFMAHIETACGVKEIRLIPAHKFAAIEGTLLQRLSVIRKSRGV